MADPPWQTTADATATTAAGDHDAVDIEERGVQLLLEPGEVAAVVLAVAAEADQEAGQVAVALGDDRAHGRDDSVAAIAPLIAEKSRVYARLAHERLRVFEGAAELVRAVASERDLHVLAREPTEHGRRHDRVIAERLVEMLEGAVRELRVGDPRRLALEAALRRAIEARIST